MSDTVLMGRPWYELLVTDDELDALVHEERSRHPCRKAVSTLVTTAVFLPPLIAAHHIFLVVTERGFAAAPVATCFALTAVGLLELPLMYAANEFDPANTAIRARRDATARLSKLPLIIRYYFISSLETNGGRIHRYRALPIPPESLPVNRFPECDCWASLNGKHLIVSALKIGGAHPFLLSFGHSGVMKCVEKIKTTSAVFAFISLRAASWIVPDHIRRPAEKAFLYHISNNLRKDIKINALRRFYPAFRRLGKKQ